MTPLDFTYKCDEEANACMEGDSPLGSFELLLGYGAMLKLGGNWVTTHLWANIKIANTSPLMITYILRQLNIDIDTFYCINWGAIGNV